MSSKLTNCALALLVLSKLDEDALGYFVTLFFVILQVKRIQGNHRHWRLKSILNFDAHS